MPAREDPHADYLRLVAEAVDGPRSFFRKRESIDEFGWRNFGDTWADHEDVHFEGERPIVSHYNNQYDLLYGFLLHFARTSDPRWFGLASDLARHVIDIDLYHTSEDKPAYSGGMFWHTDHYQGAGRGTHRSYTSDSPLARRGRAYGGGPSNEHNYTTGLLYFHYFTGEPSARDAVRQLADWVSNMDDGAQSLLGALDRLVSDLRDQGLGSALANVPPPLGKAARQRAENAFKAAANGKGRVLEIFEILTLTGWKD